MNVLETERLRLRWFTPDDAPFVLELLTDPSWLRFIGDRQVRTLDDARAYIDRGPLDMCRRLGYGLWVVEPRRGGHALGMCGLIKREGLADVDLGFAFLPRYRGQGLAREAAVATLSYGRRVVGLKRIVAITSPDNDRSARLLGAIGMVREQTLRLLGEERESVLFGWGGDRAEIDALVRTFYAAFTNRGDAKPTLHLLPELFLPEALVIKSECGAPQVESLTSFLKPRALLFGSGELTEFHEAEVAERTDICGQIAQRMSAYEKRGILRGQPFFGRGSKLLQLVATAAGWKISSLAWMDHG
jgi:RimJ/RimL family protein N-acetyltransferase